MSIYKISVTWFPCYFNSIFYFIATIILPIVYLYNLSRYFLMNNLEQCKPKEGAALKINCEFLRGIANVSLWQAVIIIIIIRYIIDQQKLQFTNSLDFINFTVCTWINLRRELLGGQTRSGQPEQINIFESHKHQRAPARVPRRWK